LILIFLGLLDALIDFVLCVSTWIWQFYYWVWGSLKNLHYSRVWGSLETFTFIEFEIFKTSYSTEFGVSKILPLSSEMNIWHFVQSPCNCLLRLKFNFFGLQLQYQHQWFNSLVSTLSIQYLFSIVSIYIFVSHFLLLEKFCLENLYRVFVTSWINVYAPAWKGY